MTLPNMDTRRIKRVFGDHFTIEPLSALNDPKSLICNHCAVQKCKVRNYVKRIPHDQAVVKVASCAMFLPTLGFSVLDGLDLPDWNTVRIGNAWANRLLTNRIVAIADTKNGVLLENYYVTSVFTGKLESILEIHAKNNHAILAEIASGRTKSEDAPERLLRILKNAYGTNIASVDRSASVIYLRKV